MKKILSILLLMFCVFTGYSAGLSFVHIVNNTRQTIIIYTPGSKVVIKPDAELYGFQMPQVGQDALVSIYDSQAEKPVAESAFKLFVPNSQAPCTTGKTPAYPVDIVGSSISTAQPICSVIATNLDTYFWLTFNYPEGPNHSENKNVVHASFYADLAEPNGVYVQQDLDIPMLAPINS